MIGRILLIAMMFINCRTAFADDYLGSLGTNRYDPNSINNPYGKGSQYDPNSVNNSYGQYGSKYSDRSANNPYAQNAPKIYDDQGTYRGKLSANPTILTQHRTHTVDMEANILQTVSIIPMRMVAEVPMYMGDSGITIAWN